MKNVLIGGSIIGLLIVAYIYFNENYEIVRINESDEVTQREREVLERVQIITNGTTAEVVSTVRAAEKMNKRYTYDFGLLEDRVQHLLALSKVNFHEETYEYELSKNTQFQLEKLKLLLEKTQSVSVKDFEVTAYADKIEREYLY